MLAAGESGGLVVVDIGGGTTDITSYEIKTIGGVLDVRCVGFDGMIVGGRWITRVVADLLARKLIEIASRKGKALAIEMPQPGSKQSGPAAQNWAGMKLLAERLKLTLHDGGKFSVAEFASLPLEAQNLVMVTIDGSSMSLANWLASMVQSNGADVLIEPSDLASDIRYRTFVSNVVDRARCADNLTAREGEWPKEGVRVILTGRLRIVDCYIDSFQRTFLHRPGYEGVGRAAELAVTNGLESYAKAIQEGKRLRVGGLQRAVLVPVGEIRDGEWCPVLCRWIRFVFRHRCVKAPRSRILSVSRLLLRCCGCGQMPMESELLLMYPRDFPRTYHIVILEAATGASGRDYDSFRYDIWINEVDELRGALYVRVPQGDATTKFDKHPVLEALVALCKSVGQDGGGGIRLIDDGEVASGFGWSITCVEVRCNGKSVRLQGEFWFLPSWKGIRSGCAIDYVDRQAG